MRTADGPRRDRACPLRIAASPGDQASLAFGRSDEYHRALRFERIADGRGGFVSEELGESRGIDQATNDRIIGIK